MKQSILFAMLLIFTACSGESFEVGEYERSLQEPAEEPAKQESPSQEINNLSTCVQSLYQDQLQPITLNANCKKANQSQMTQVDQGNNKKEKFLSTCYNETNLSCWCDQVIRPNPKSIDIFHCTYGENQVHQLIHPDESTWDNAIEAVKIVQDLEAINLETEVIYNWWRPEPYNKNVGGSPTRHPFGTSVDIRFKSKDMQNLAFRELCKMRKKGRLRAIGYYPSTAIHLGVGDNTANTWGKSCP